MVIKPNNSEDGNRKNSRLDQIIEGAVAPRDYKVWIFAVLLKASDIIGFRQFKNIIKLLFVEVAPSIPVSLRNSITGTAGHRAAIIGGLATLFFCLIVPLCWTYKEGRFSSELPTNMFFLQDTTNFFLYALICPLYVGLGCWLITTVITGWGDIKEYQPTTPPEHTPRQKSRIFYVKNLWLVVLLFSIGAFSTANYINDIMNPANVTQRYWFMEVSLSGEQYLGTLGVYYFLMNFTLLMVTLISITFFMSVFVALIDVGKKLGEAAHPEDTDYSTLESKLGTFTEAYILAKLLTFLYMINFILWKRSPLGQTQNIYVAFICLTMFGVFFVSIPRYFLELQWYRFQVRTGQVKVTDDVYKDIRPFGIRVVASVLDSLLIGSFVVGVTVDLFFT